MSHNQIKVRSDSQDRERDDWKALLEFIDLCEKNGEDVFHPTQQFDLESWVHVRSLPKEIGRLKKLKHLMLYGSNLTRLPQEIGKLDALEKFTPYTSYGLRWFPYEITRCLNLAESKVSTSVLFGNYKNNKEFPDLANNPVDYHGGNICSICSKIEVETRFEQYWISCLVANDVLPLLVIICSGECFYQIKESATDYHSGPHKGGGKM